MKKNPEVRIQESESISGGLRPATRVAPLGETPKPHSLIKDKRGGLKLTYSSAASDSNSCAHSDS